MVVEFKKCCFCGDKIVGWGNNPWPANKDEDAVCCDYCNRTVVVPARLEELAKQKEETKQVKKGKKNEKN